MHCNNSIDEQVAIVKQVKNHQLGYVVFPVVMGPDSSIGDVDELRVSPQKQSILTAKLNLLISVLALFRIQQCLRDRNRDTWIKIIRFLINHKSLRDCLFCRYCDFKRHGFCSR